MTEEEKKRLEALVKSQFSDENVVIPSFTASQIMFIQKLIDLRIAEWQTEFFKNSGRP